MSDRWLRLERHEAMLELVSSNFSFASAGSNRTLRP
jgi:hypothetical protein